MSGRWVYAEDERTKDLAKMGFSVIRWTSKAKVLASGCSREMNWSSPAATTGPASGAS